MTALNVALNVTLIRGLGPIPAYGTRGAAMGTAIASGIIGIYSLWKLARGGWVVSFAHRGGWGPDWPIIRALFRFGLPTGIQGIAMNVGGVLLLSFIGSLAQSAASQAAYAVSYTELFSLVTWTSQGLLGAAAAIAGQNLGAGRPDRTVQGVHAAARFGIAGAAFIGLLFLVLSAATARDLRHARSRRRRDRRPTASRAQRERRVHFRRSHVHGRPARDGRHQEPALHLHPFAARHSARHVLRVLAVRRARSRSRSGSRSSPATRRAAS